MANNFITEEQAVKALSKGYFVDVRFGQPKTTVTVNPKQLGLNVEGSEEAQSFIDTFIENNRVSFVGKRNELVRKITNVAKAVHGRKKAMALGNTDNFMTPEVLEEFKAFVAEKETEYYELRDKLAEDYYYLISDFKRKLEKEFLEKSLNQATEEEVASVVNQIAKRIPSKEQLEGSFSVNLRRTRVILPHEVGEDEKDEVVSEVYAQVNEITGKTLNIGFESLNKLMDIYSNTGTLTGRNKTSLKKLADEIDKRNIFSQSFLSDLSAEMRANAEESVDSLIESIEVLICKIYSKSLELNISESINLNATSMDQDYMTLIGGL